MYRFLFLATSVLLGYFLLPNITYAKDSTTQTTTNPSDTTSDNLSVSKDEWLNAVKPDLPNLICTGFEADPSLKLRFDEIKMTHAQCVATIPDSINRCQQQYYTEIPDTINNQSATTWGKTLGECIGKDFVLKYLMPKSDQSDGKS